MVTRSWPTHPRQRPVSSIPGRKVPILVLADVSGHFPAADLLVEGVEQLLAGSGPGEGRPPIERAAETALVAKTFGRPVEGHPQAVHEVDDPRRPIGQFLYRRLVLQKVAAVDGVFKMLPFAVAQLPRQVVDAVDAALGADAMRPLQRQDVIMLTSHSNSASLMAAAIPASPPPMIITDGFAMTFSCV